MDYEKKYKEALTRAESFYRNGKGSTKSMVYTIFPELAENESAKIRKEIVDFICWTTDRGCITREQREKSYSWIAWLEKQSEQKPAEWSEEDERMLHETIAYAEASIKFDDTPQLDWLKSIRDRVKPQKQWKPSNEQMSALKEQCVCKKSTVAGEVLCELYHDLEKLREE